MGANRPHRCQGYRRVGLFAGLLGLLTLGTVAWSQGTGRQAEDARPRRAAQGLQVVVQAGRLSVDLQEADLGEVLAQIGRQAGIRMASGPSAGKRVSSQFAGVELEEGLRRLLRLASLSHSVLYATGPAGTVAMTEVRVLGEGKDSSPRPATGVEPRVEEVEANEPTTGAPVRKARRQAPEVVAPVQEPASNAEQGKPNEAMRRVLDAFTRSKQMGASSPDGQDASPPAPQPSGQEPGDGEGGAR